MPQGLTNDMLTQVQVKASDNGLLTGWRPAIICTNAGILLIRP